MGKHPRGGPNVDKFIRQEDDGYKDACKDGYKSSGTTRIRGKNRSYFQVHHVLCLSCLTDSSIEMGNKSYIEKCMKLTEWDINKPPNLLGMPIKLAYLADEGNPKWDGIPCHQVEHPIYTDNIRMWINSEIWANLNTNVAACDVNGKDIAGLLEAGSDLWRGELKARGKEHGGTRQCWIHRDGKKRSVWYIPFSMNIFGTPTPRQPFPESKRLNKSVTTLLKTLLQP